ncbi:nucleotide exchange factor GrpE [Sporosarcina sp. P20a]|nr:nucleotide exchange factor GrpE [Sporosarcina sp. P20a]
MIYALHMFSEKGNSMSTIHESANNRPEELQRILDKELLQLEKITIEDFEVDPIEKPVTQEDLKQFQQFTSTSFRSLEELLESNQAILPVDEAITRLQDEAFEDRVQMAKRAVQIFTLFEDVRQSVDPEAVDLLAQLDAAMDQAQLLLEEIGIQELPVYDEYFDESYMEVVGTIPAEEAQGIERFKVASVFRRAFSIEDQVIQDALVKTVS